jgi:hypothetical protein
MPMDTDDSGNIEVLEMGDEQANPVNPRQICQRKHKI